MSAPPPEQVQAFRAARHRLQRRAPRRDLLRVVGDLVGVQAQLPAAAYLSLWARVDGIAPADVEGGLYRARTLARAWCLRGTAHIVTREARPLLAAALGAEPGGMKRFLLRRGILDPAAFERLRAAALDALSDGPLVRAEVEAAVAARTPGGAGLFGSWGGLLRILSQEGDVVFGPPRGQEATFVRADRWWRGDRKEPPPRDRALPELFRRYLRSYGPSTPADFAYWSGLGVAQAKEAAAALGDEVATVPSGAKGAHLLRRDLAALADARPAGAARLLPSFDAFLLGWKDKSLLFDRRHYKAVFRAAGWVSPTIAIDGRVVGTWAHERRGDALAVRLAPFDRLPAGAVEGLRAEAESLARFLGATRARLSVDR